MKLKTEKLLDGYLVLGELWNKGFTPRDIYRHYLLTVIAFGNGYITKSKKISKLNGHYRLSIKKTKRYLGPVVLLRHAWKRVNSINRSENFYLVFHEFYESLKLKPKLTKKQNGELIKLWAADIPFKVLILHYVLWGIRNDKRRSWIRKKLGITNRHLFRLFVRIFNSERKESGWLSVLKPKKSEFYIYDLES